MCKVKMSALMQAILQRRWRQAKLLLESGCNVNGRGPNGRTPLMEMCFIDNEAKAAGLAKVLLEKGANLGLKDNEGRTAMSSACLLHRKRLFRLFINSVDFDLNASDVEGNTALFHAISAGDEQVVKQLVAKMLHYGVTIDVLNKKGETPLIYALKSKKREIADILVRLGKASLEARDLEFQKSASEWRDELIPKKQALQIPSSYFKKYGTKNKGTKSKQKKTGSANAQSRLETRVVLTRVSQKARPTTAPDRILVPTFFKPSSPVKKSLGKLYMIYNQQTTESYRKGYKAIRYRDPQLGANSSGSKKPSSRSGVSFNQVNELSVKLQGLYKNTACKKKVLGPEIKMGLPRIDSENSLTGRSSSKSSRRGCKIMKNMAKTVRQFDNIKNTREVASGIEINLPK